jgi:hypothetical protein
VGDLEPVEAPAEVKALLAKQEAASQKKAAGRSRTRRGRKPDGTSG